MKTAIVVTGGTRGISLGIAQSLARDGYNLVLGYHMNHEAAQCTTDAIEKEYGVKVRCSSGDISLPETMEKLFDVIRSEFNNELTAFVHNAGLYVGVTTEATDIQPKATDDFEEVFEYYQKVYPRAFERGLQLAQTCNGLLYVIAVSSPGCNCNQTHQTNYEMPGQAKVSMEFLVRVHALLLAKKGVTVNGLIETESWDRIIEKRGVPPAMIDALVKNSPAGRWAQPSEIGDVVAFLCSTRGRFITGVALPIDGGLHLSTPSA